MKIGTKAWIVTKNNECHYATFKLGDTGIFIFYYWETHSHKRAFSSDQVKYI